jgi:DNA-binding MarR family transcriptional regulator
VLRSRLAIVSAASAPQTNPASPIAVQIIDLANELVGRIFMHLVARAAELNLTLAEAKALQQLEVDRAMPMREVAARLHANPSNVTVIVARLESRGFLSRELGADRRVKGVRLTALGAEQRARLEARLQADHPAIRGLSADEQRELLELLRRLTRLPQGALA